MTIHDRQYRLLGANLVFWLAALAGGAGGGKAEGPAIDWDSSRMREIEAEWRLLRDAYKKDPRGDGKGSWSARPLFQTRLSPGMLRQLADSPKFPSPTDPKKPDRPGEFVPDLLAFMVRTFVQTGDRERLVDVLSKRCPSLIEWPETVEYWLAFQGWKLKEPMLILGEAYARSRVPKTRSALAASVRRSFAGLGIRGKDDAEFVDNAMRWYQREKGHLIVNARYPRNELDDVGITVGHSYERRPDLFDNPPLGREPLFKERIVPTDGPRNLGEDPDR